MTPARRAHLILPNLIRHILDTDSRWLRVEEYIDDETLVVRAEMPGVDPEAVELSVVDGALHIRGEREDRTAEKSKECRRTEFRYGTFMRDLALPAGVHADDIKASYNDGILEIRVPLPEEAKSTASKVPITHG